MDMFRSIISQKADADRCYFYIDDERTVRLEKILDLPNSFEVKKAQITEKEKTEKLKREAIEIYYNRTTTPNEETAIK
jgi:predicted P-loop ATPase